MKNSYRIEGTEVFINVNRKGQFFESIISLTDLARAKSFPNTWFLCKYVQGQMRANGKIQTVYLHRWITEASSGTYVDHKNHNTLINTRNNLRIGNQSQNMQNRSGAQSNNESSGFRGVYWVEAHRNWRVKVEVKGMQHHIGCFNNLQEAISASEKARKELMQFSKESEGAI